MYGKERSKTNQKAIEFEKLICGFFYLSIFLIISIIQTSCKPNENKKSDKPPILKKFPENSQKEFQDHKSFTFTFETIHINDGNISLVLFSKEMDKKRLLVTYCGLRPVLIEDLPYKEKNLQREYLGIVKRVEVIWNDGFAKHEKNFFEQYYQLTKKPNSTIKEKMQQRKLLERNSKIQKWEITLYKFIRETSHPDTWKKIIKDLVEQFYRNQSFKYGTFENMDYVDICKWQ